jgi:hypothetical protein
MSVKITRKGILPVILLLTILVAMAGIMTRYVQAESSAKQLSSQYLNSVKKYLNMSDQKTSSYDFNIKSSSKEEGATYTWYIRLDKGNPDSIKIDQKTGVVTAVKAGTAYVRCKITLADGTILRPEASVIVRNNITEVSISNIPEDLTIEAGKVKDFNRTVLNTDAGKGVKTQGITRWELAKDTAGVGSVNLKGEVLPLKMGEFNIRAICFQSKERYKLWLSDKAKYADYVTAASEWVTIKVTDVKEAATAATQEQLDILLQSDDINQIAITTDKEITFVIPKGDYTSKTLIVNAKNADVENYGIFKDIIINAIKDHTWIEFADGNIIYLNDDIVSFIIEKDVKVKQIIIDRPNSAINLEIRGTVEQIHVLQPSNLDIGGNSQDIPVTVSETAGGSSIQTSVPLNLVFMADTQVKLNKGAEGTVLDKSSSAQIEIENNTEASVRITTEKSGGETVESGTSVVSNGTSNPTQTPAPSLVSITAISGIIGTPQVGVELSAGAVSPVEATVNYQWKISTSENGAYTNIPGATFPKYTPVDGDQGNYIKVTATGTGSFTGSVTSLASAAVLASESKLQEEAETAITAYENAAIVTLTDIATAEGLKAAADTAVNNVGDATIKAAFEQRITNRASEIALVRAELETQLDAELAVAAYEITPITTLAEVTAAEGLKAAADTAVAAVGSADVKAAFGIRIINRTIVIAETRAELENQAAANAAVTAYEVAPISTLGEVFFAEGLKAPAEAAVSAVGDVAVKTALEQRIADRAVDIADARVELEAEMEADLAVTAYEMAPITTLTEVTVAESRKAAADTTVSLVGNVAVKAVLEQRITDKAAEIAEARAKFEAELAVIAYEVAPIKTLAEVAAAESRKAAADTAVLAVGDVAVKAAFGLRITNRATEIAEARTELEAELDAELAIVAYETAPITTLTEVAIAEGLKATADTAVLDVGNATVKAAMELRITNRALEIADARTELEAEIEAQLDAELAVATYEAAPITTLAEITMAEGLKAAADATVSAVSDVAANAAFGLRITNRAAEIAQARADLEAEAAANAIVTGYELAPINSLSEITLAEAMKAPTEAAVSIVVNITVKTALELRITNRAEEIASAKTILVAEEAVNLAEISNLQTDLDGAQVLVTALPDGVIKTLLQARIDGVQNIIDATEANTLSITHAKAAIEAATYNMTQADASSEANVEAAIETIISGLDLEGVTAVVNKVSYTLAIAGMELTPTGTNGMYTFTVSLSKGVGNTLASDSTTNLSMNITATVYVPPEIINSVQIMNFNFATIDSSPAQLISKPITTTTFSTDNKYFTITDGLGNVIVVDLWWDLPTDTFTPAQMVGSAIESSIQDYFNAHGGLENRTLWAASFSGDTFTLSSFASGVVNTITIEGPDGSYFFETLYDQGSDLDMSANRAFSISDGTHTANITLDTDLTNMDGLISEINSYLTGYSVQAEAVKISEDSFKIVGDDITIDGANKAEFFSSYVSE